MRAEGPWRGTWGVGSEEDWGEVSGVGPEGDGLELPLLFSSMETRSRTCLRWSRSLVGLVLAVALATLLVADVRIVCSLSLVTCIYR